jgi:hypothetical protein
MRTLKTSNQRVLTFKGFPAPEYLAVYLSAQAVMQTQMTPDEIQRKSYIIKLGMMGRSGHSIRNDWDPVSLMKWLCDQPKSELSRPH